jgi:predicted ATPase
MLIHALDYITIRGFKSIASIERLPLRPINVVIGPNGSGKSNFLGAFGLLHEFLEHRLDDYVTVAGGAEKILHFGSKATRKSSSVFGSRRVNGSISSVQLRMTDFIPTGEGSIQGRHRWRA